MYIEREIEATVNRMLQQGKVVKAWLSVLQASNVIRLGAGGAAWFPYGSKTDESKYQLGKLREFHAVGCHWSKQKSGLCFKKCV